MVINLAQEGYNGKKVEALIDGWFDLVAGLYLFSLVCIWLVFGLVVGGCVWFGNCGWFEERGVNRQNSLKKKGLVRCLGIIVVIFFKVTSQPLQS